MSGLSDERLAKIRAIKDTGWMSGVSRELLEEVDRLRAALAVSERRANEWSHRAGIATDALTASPSDAEVEAGARVLPGWLDHVTYSPLSTLHLRNASRAVLDAAREAR